MNNRWLVVAVCSLLALPVLAQAPRATIEGSVIEDVRGDGHERVPRPGVTVLLYRAGVPQPSRTTTDAGGRFAFAARESGEYSLVVDGRSVTPSAGTTGRGEALAEQTFGPSGAICGGAEPRAYGGPCYGGRNATRSDDASSLDTAEHVARIRFDGTPIVSLDFGFSFNVVTRADDPAGPAQGTLRQFIANANAVRGANTMHFVPAVAATQSIQRPSEEPESWWLIALASPLPDVADDDTTIDGTAFSSQAADLALNTFPGTVGSTGVRGVTITPPDAPELEIAATGDNGIVFAARGGLRRVSVHGGRTIVSAHGDAAIENSVIGAGPTGAALPTPADTAIAIAAGTTVVRRTLIAHAASYGILTAGSGRLDLAGSEVTDCGATGTGAAVALRSDGSVIRASFLHKNAGPAIEIGAGGGSAANNVVEDSAIADNLVGIALGPAASGTIVTGNDLIWNRAGAIVAAGTAPPVRTRIAQNHFNENGGLPIALTATSKESETAGSCGGVLTPTPKVDEARLVSHDGTNATIEVRGTACPGATVEVYSSFVTNELVERASDTTRRDLPSIREALSRAQSVESRDEALQAMHLPSIAEFNFAGAAKAGADGGYNATLKVTVGGPIAPAASNTIDIYQFRDELSRGGLSVAAIAVDAGGNTSEFSRRKVVSGTRTR